MTDAITDKELQELADEWKPVMPTARVVRAVEGLLALREAVRREREVGNRKTGNLANDLEEFRSARAHTDRLVAGEKE